jgi:hypothetical protein
MDESRKISVVINAVKPPAYALVDKATRLIRMDDESKALAIFDSRQAARDAAKVHANTMVIPITLQRFRV